MKYYKLEQRDSFDMHKTRTVYRIKNRQTYSGQDFIKQVAHRHGFSESVIMGVLADVAAELEELLGQGSAVALPGIGTFSLGVRLNDERKRQLRAEQEAAALAAEEGQAEGQVAGQDVTEPNSRNIELHHINFRKDKGFFDRVAKRFEQQPLERVGGREGSRITLDDTTQRQRIEAAHQYLATHHYMHVADYAALTGLSRSTAQRELRELARYRYSGITSEGRGSHRVYVRRQD